MAKKAIIAIASAIASVALVTGGATVALANVPSGETVITTTTTTFETVTVTDEGKNPFVAEAVSGGDWK